MMQFVDLRPTFLGSVPVWQTFSVKHLELIDNDGSKHTENRHWTNCEEVQLFSRCAKNIGGLLQIVLLGWNMQFGRPNSRSCSNSEEIFQQHTNRDGNWQSIPPRIAGFAQGSFFWVRDIELRLTITTDDLVGRCGFLSIQLHVFSKQKSTDKTVAAEYLKGRTSESTWEWTNPATNRPDLAVFLCQTVECLFFS